MQFTTTITALILAFSAVSLAAPTAIPQGTSSLADFNEVIHTLEAREAVCNPKVETDKAKRTKQLEELAKMRTFTATAHSAENKCPTSKLAEFERIKKSAKPRAETLKKDCISAYKQCVTARKGANGACKKAGGVVDQGHLSAVTHCQDEGKKWAAKVVPK